MLVTIKKQTQPDVASANLVLYSKEENDKMLNNPELQEKLNNGTLYLSSELLEGNGPIIREPDPMSRIGIVKEIRDDSIDVEMNDKNYKKYIYNIESGVLVAGMRMGVKDTVIDDDGIMLLKDIELSGFDLIYDNPKDKYYEMQTPNKSFRQLFSKLYKKNDSYLDRMNAAEEMQLYNKNLNGYKNINDLNEREVFEECVKNPWYFFRNVFKFNSFDGPKNYDVNIGTYCIIDAFINNIGLIQYIPRQKGSTITLIGIFIYIKYFTKYTAEYKTRDPYMINMRIKECEDLIPKKLLDYAQNNIDNMDLPSKRVVLWDEFEFIINENLFPEPEENTLHLGASVFNRGLNEYTINKIMENYSKNYDNECMRYSVTDYKEVMTGDEFNKTCKLLNNDEDIINSEIKLVR